MLGRRCLAKKGNAMSTREFDVVLYGATGFVGRQTVAYFAHNAPKGLRWAIAGRDHAKLAALGAEVPILTADARSQPDVDAIVAKTRVVLTTAGPFELYGDPLVDACVRLGTHYVDISGEPARIRALIDHYHQSAKVAGVRIVNFCAISSAPSDLGVYLLDKALGGRLREAKGYFRLGGASFNGGTIASISHAHETGVSAREKDVFLLNPDLGRPAKPLEFDPKGVHYDREVKAWTTASPMGVSNTRAVRRSAALTGHDIVYQEYATYPGYLDALGFDTMIGLFNAAMSVRPVRQFLQRKLPPGSGPSDADMDAGWFELKMLGKSDRGQSAMVTMKGQGDVGNRITVRCVCESALAIALNEAELPAAFGVLTPSVAFGDVLVQRLENAGIGISATAL
jgi:short subunit dehydrogenase-like uncharacterized protein